jgi:hypothetical protein
MIKVSEMERGKGEVIMKKGLSWWRDGVFIERNRS